MHLNRKMQTGCFSPQYNLHIFTQFAALLKCPYSTFYTSYKITFVFVPIKLRVSYWFCHANANHRNIRYCHCRRRSYLLHSLPLYYCYHRTVSTANVLIRIIVISTIGFVQAKTIPICGWIFKFSLILMRSTKYRSNEFKQTEWDLDVSECMLILFSTILKATVMILYLLRDAPIYLFLLLFPLAAAVVHRPMHFKSNFACSAAGQVKLLLISLWFLHAY